MYRSQYQNVREMPLCYPSTYREVRALLGNGQDALLGKEELLDGAFSSRMSTVGSIALEAGAVE
jgi:hypothetical protein